MSGNEKEWNRVFKSLYCQNIHFVQGNHESDNKINKYINDYHFTHEGFVHILKYSKKYRFYLSHYPTLTGNFEYDKVPVWNLSGHTHMKNKFYDNYPCVYNVALDAHDCYPVSLETIKKDIQKHVEEKNE